MMHGEKIEKIKIACAEFVQEHWNESREFSKHEIDVAIQSKIDFKLNWKVSDFSKGETDKPRSKNNGDFFVRTRYGYYRINK